MVVNKCGDAYEKILCYNNISDNLAGYLLVVFVVTH